MAGIASFLIALKARISAAPFEKATRDPTATQEALLRRMMEKNRDTEYGREHGFAEVRSLADYRAKVPVVDYEDIRERIDRMTLGETGILTTEDPVLFAQTSGTTGTPKYIPVTPTCQQGGGMTTWLHYARRDHPDHVSRQDDHHRLAGGRGPHRGRAALRLDQRHGGQGDAERSCSRPTPCLTRSTRSTTTRPSTTPCCASASTAASASSAPPTRPRSSSWRRWPTLTPSA